MSRAGRARAALGMGLREYRRTPVLLALLAFLPAYFVVAMVQLVPDGTARIRLADGAVARVDLVDAFATMATPMAAALATGIAGLFVMHSARDADARLAVAGFRASELVAGRLGLLAAVATAVSALSLGALLLFFAPERIGWFVAGVALVALTYGTVGVLAGVVLDRLPGVYLLLFGPTLDLFLLQNPTILDPHAVAPALPSHYGLEVAVTAAFDGPAPTTLARGLGYLFVLAVLAALALYRSLNVG